MTDKRKITQRWAVENENESGTVRYMETFQKGVAEAVAQRNNTAFAAAGSESRSVVIKAGQFLVGEMEDR